MRRCDTYEEVATYLLNQFAAEFGLERVEEKQPVEGKDSGTSWMIDAKGIREVDGAMIIVECRRHTKAPGNQEELGGLAYRIIDTEAAGGIYVSPLGFQKGASKVAAARNIVSVELSPESTNTEYMMKFMRQIFVGLEDILTLTDSFSCEIEYRKADGSPDHVERFDLE